MTETLIPKTEVVEYKNQVSFIQQKALELVIETEEDMKEASDLLKAIKDAKKAIVDRKNMITRPLMDGLASARELFKPFEKGQAEAEATIRQKMLEFSIKEEERIKKEQERVEARVEKGTMREDTAVKKLEKIGDVSSSFDGSMSKTSLRTVKKVRITDETLIPREYLVIDIKAVTDAILRDKKDVPGTEVYEEKSIVNRTL